MAHANSTSGDEDQTTKEGADWLAMVETISIGLMSLCGSCATMFLAQYVQSRKGEELDRQLGELFQSGQMKDRTPYKPLLDTFKQKDSESLYIPAFLYESYVKRIGGPVSIIDSYKTFLSKIDSELDEGQLMRMQKCLRPDIPVRRDTRVSVVDSRGNRRHLHMNKMYDFIGESILMGQPPFDREQWGDHWRAIWEEKVGVIVWLGNGFFQGDPRMRFEAYAPVEAWRPQDAVWDNGEFVVKVEESFIQHKPDSFYLHKILLTKKTGTVANRAESRHLLIVHMEWWLDPSEPWWFWERSSPGVFIKILLEALAFTQYRLFKKPKEGATPLRGLLVNCPSGVAQSVTFVLVYICRQMWLLREKARVKGVLKYIRRHRYMAWGTLSDDELFSEIRICFAAMRTIINRKDEQMGYGSSSSL